MSQQTTFDPFSMWKSIYDKMEENYSDMLQESMKKEAFAEWMGQSLNTFLLYQDFIQKTTETYLKQMNMPTREEVSNVASLVINLEEKVENLDDKFFDFVNDKQLATEVNRIKLNVSKLDKKLDQVLTLLEQTANQSKQVASQNKQVASNEKK
ncbi:poly(R)-hydroxyalkanoic acid synthase subunit PhaE [Bacillus sp. FJAT-47783]|uniref:poly(R)-hydroxyalkanoic acid synthase subunit PhaE n=1 Tax=Bacillus sp. FJAT-47783 TaxID=2922712 RepID=UPI001FACF44E|nr:poly(R)-hydroxyalkanoic acid synthase subunit PhaE [Bacillus sp. FJAT-47783]